MPYNSHMSDDPVARFRRAYWRAFRELDSVRLRQWEEYRLTLPQLRVLYHIRRAPGVTGGEIAAALGITVSTVSGLVGKLTERGLLTRGTAPDDRRQAPLELTPEGLVLVGALSETNQAFTAQVAAALGDELETITASLERLAAAAEAAHPAIDGPDASADSVPTSSRLSVNGTVVEALPNGMFTVALDDGKQILGSLSGKLRTRYTQLRQGDRVTLELSPYEESRGQITFVFE
jgi:translation initiation factor IF-1